MRKLLSIVLIFALLLNTSAPALAQAIDYERSVKDIYNETSRYLSDQKLKNKLQTAMNELIPYTRRAAQLIKEIDAAWNAGEEDLAYVKEQELADIRKRVNDYITLAHDLHVEQLKDKALANGMHRSEIIPESIPLGELTPITNYDQFQKDAENGRVKFEQLIHYVRPTGDGSIYSSDPMAVALAAQMLGEIATNLQGDSEQARRFANNELFTEPDSPVRFRSDLLYIQKTMLRKLTELHAKENPSIEEVQAIGSLRIALLRILTFYFKSNIPNPLYFYDINRPEEKMTGQETEADRKASQEKLTSRMYEGFVNDLKTYAQSLQGLSKFQGPGVDVKLANMAATGSFAVLYASLYKPGDRNALYTLFKAVPTDEQKPLKKTTWKNPDRNYQEDTKYWEDPENTLEDNFNAVLIAMLATVTDVYKNNGQGAPYAFYRAIIARPGEGYTGKFFPLLVRMTAIEESLSFQPAKGSDFANFVAYQTLTMYCPLVDKGASSVYGLDAKKGMPELATRLAAMFVATYASPSSYGNNSTQSYLKKTPDLVKVYASDPLRGVMCGVTTDLASNVNQDAIDAEIFKTHLGIVEEAIFWIFGGKILKGAFGILKKAIFLPVALARSVKVGYSVYKDIKVATKAQKVIELSRVNAEFYEAAKGFTETYRGILQTAARVKDMGTLRYYQKFVTEAENIVLKARKGTATAQQARNVTEIQRVGKEIETLTKELDQARKEINQIEAAMQGAKEIDIAKALEKTTARAQQIERDLQRAVNTLHELSTGEKVVGGTGTIVQGSANATLGLADGSAAATAQAAAKQAAAKTAASFTDGAAVEEAYGAYESAFKQALRAGKQTLRDELAGSYAIKGFLRDNSAQLIFEVETEGGKVERMVIDSNRACRKWAGVARKAYIRQNTFTTPSWFELSEVPGNFSDLGRMVRGAKQSMKAAQAAGNLEEGFRTYTLAQAKALNEIIRTRSSIARQVAKDGGVDVYMEIEVPGESVYSAEGELLHSAPAKTMYWNTAYALPEQYLAKPIEEATVYILPKGTQTAALVEAERLVGKGVATTYTQLEKTLYDTLLDQTIFAITGKANPGRLSTMLEKLTQKFYKNDFTIQDWVGGNVVANLAVSPTTIVVNSGKNIFTRVISGMLSVGPQAKVSSIFLKATAPKFVPESLKSIYVYGSKFLKSEFAINLYFFEALYGLDQIQGLRNVQSGMIKEFAQRDLDKELEKYPHLKQAVAEEKANPSTPKIAEVVQQAQAEADSQYRGLIITIPFFAARRFLSDVRSMSGMSALSWLDFNTISDLQREQFQMREKQLVLKPLVEEAMQGITSDLFDKSLDEQKDKLINGDEFKELSTQDPTLKKDLEDIFEQHRREVKEIISKKNSSPQEQSQAIENASKRLEKKIHDRVLQGQEKSYQASPIVKEDKQLSADIHQAFESYRKRAEKIFNNSSLNAQARQDQLGTERTKLNENIAQKISQAQERSLLNSPEVSALIKEEGNNSQLKKDIEKAFKDYRAQERALTQRYSGTDQSQADALKRALEAEQRKLNVATTKAIQAASLRAFKNSPTMKAFIEVDKDFEKEIDALFNSHSDKLVSVLQSAALPQAQKEKRIKTLNEELAQGIFELQMKEAEKLDLQNPEVLLFSAAYPAVKEQLHQLYQNYKSEYQALQKQTLPANQLEEKIKKQEQDFLMKKQALIEQYFTQSQSDIHFWRNVASNVNKQQWAEIAAMRQSVNQYLLLQNLPNLEGKALELINQQLVIFMEQQIAFYDDPSITNMDIAMRALMLEENNYLASLLFVCGDQNVMEQYGIESFEEIQAEQEMQKK